MHVFVAGGTGYVGRPLIADLLRRGHEVRALVRRGSEAKIPAGCGIVTGDALSAASYASAVGPANVFVHLVGVPHPSPWKGDEFRSVDLTALQASVDAARSARVEHFVYMSVAHPAPVMKVYIEVRCECEAAIRASGLNATLLRPWYVLGPGHRWPYALVPIYWLLERIAATRESARRLGLVTLSQMVSALAAAVECPSAGVRIVEVPEIRKA
jgi:uncharacterized protein YbjT (DUF2867 family)